jgi:hypothetical protein
MSAQLLGGSADNPDMSQHDATSCRLRAARWKLDEVRTMHSLLEAERAGDSQKVGATALWAEICALRALAWREEAERV